MRKIPENSGIEKVFINNNLSFKGDNMKKWVILPVLLILFSNLVLAAEFHDLTEDQKRQFFAQSVEQKIIPLKDFYPSSISTLAIQDPFASAGTPVIAEITISNIGKDFPFNVISLPPDSFVLLMAVDKEVAFRTEDGRVIDVFGPDSTLKNKGILKFFYYTGVGLEASVVAAKDSLTGRTCSFVNVYDNLPQSAKEYISDRNSGKSPEAVYAWDCLKITDENKFNEQVKSSCGQEKYNSGCIANINKRDSHAIINTVLVALSSDVPKGTCEVVRGQTVTSFIAKNVVKCGIGTNGLNPGESVTLRFVIIVPSDTPVISGEDLGKSGEAEGSQTFQASCQDSQFPKACHTLYAGIYPMATNNLGKLLFEDVVNLFKIGGCGVNKLWYGTATDFTQCVKSRTSSLDAIGDPIWEAQGIFYVLAPQLQGTVQLFLYAVYASGVLSALALTRKKQGA